MEQLLLVWRHDRLIVLKLIAQGPHAHFDRFMSRLYRLEVLLS